MPLLLSNEDVISVLSMSDCMEPMEAAFAELGNGTAVGRSRSDLVVPQSEPGRFYQLKTCDAALPGAGLAAVRVTSNMMQEFSDATSRRLDPLPIATGGGYVGLVLLFDMQRLDLVAIVQDARIQVMRAGAAYGIAAKYLSRGDAAVVGLLGSGQQAREQLSAIALVRELRCVNVFSPNPAHRERFAAEMSERLRVPVVARSTPRSVVEGADIVASTTTALVPAFAGEWLVPGQHVTCVRATEVDDVARERAAVLGLQSTDRTTLLMPAAGSARWPRSREPDASRIVSLSDIVVGRHPGRTDAQQITLFGAYESFGPATGYSALGAVVVERARQRGIGRELPAEWFVQRESS